MPYTTIRTQNDIQELVNHLSDPRREKPVVIVSTGKAGTVIDPDTVSSRLGSLAEVYLLANGSVAFDLEDLLPDDTGVYGGAARSYPPGNGWMTHARKSMVRLAYTPAEGAEAIDLIAGDIDNMEPLAPPVHRTGPARREPASVSAAGTVSMVMDGGGLAKMDDESIATVDTSAFPGNVLEAGMRVSGTLSEGRLDISSMLNSAPEALEAIREGGAYLARVAGPKQVELFPGLTARCRHEAAEGAVLTVRVDMKGRLDGKGWKLIPVNAEHEPSPPVLRGSSIPWLETPRTVPLPVAEEQPPAPAAEIPVPEPVTVPAAPLDPAEQAHAALDTLRAALDSIMDTNTLLADQVQELTAEKAELQDDRNPVTGPIPVPTMNSAEVLRLTSHVQRLTAEKAEMIADLRRTIVDADNLAAENRGYQLEIGRLREAVRTERERAARARSTARENANDEAAELIAFTDPEQQFRHEVYLQWVSRVPAGQKEALPLADYGFGPDFLASVDAVQGVDRSKVVSVAMEILTGLAESMPGREMHRMRATSSSTLKDHPEYGTFWRVSLQVKTASARRLHFWRGEGGRITFANIGVHDDALN